MMASFSRNRNRSTRRIESFGNTVPCVVKVFRVSQVKSERLLDNGASLLSKILRHRFL